MPFAIFKSTFTYTRIFSFSSRLPASLDLIRGNDQVTLTVWPKRRRVNSLQEWGPESSESLSGQSAVATIRCGAKKWILSTEVEGEIFMLATLLMSLLLVSEGTPDSVRSGCVDVVGLPESVKRWEALFMAQTTSLLWASIAVSNANAQSESVGNCWFPNKIWTQLRFSLSQWSFSHPGTKSVSSS